MIKTLEFKTDLPNIKILPISDVHVGDHNIDIEYLKRTIEYVKNNDDVFTVLNGDIFNQATKNSVSFEYGSTNPDDEFYQALELFKPIAHKIVMVTLGNHDDRVIRETGIDIMKHWCIMLGIEDKYVDFGGVLLVNVKHHQQRNKTFRLYFTHGLGVAGGRTAGAKLNGVKKLTDIISNADVYCIGHVHTPMFTSDMIHYVDDKHHNVKNLTRYYIVTGSFLKYGGYGQKFNYPPSSNELIEIEVSNKIDIQTRKV